LDKGSDEIETVVVITHFNDPRIYDAVDSIKKQSLKPDRIIVADGGSPSEYKEKLQDIVDFQTMFGRCIDTRRQVISYLKKDKEKKIIVFLDSDMVALNNWLINLTVPIAKGDADFTGGKILYKPSKNDFERVLNIINCKNQELLSKDVSYIPMGNSAWHMKIFDKIGSFDDSSVSNKTDKDYLKGNIKGSYHVSDDYDINIRAIQAGFKGKYIDNAVVYHNQSHINTYKKLVSYFYRQYVRTSMAYFKHKMGISKFTKGSKTTVVHPFELFLFILKPIALIHGWKEWMKVAK